MTPSYFKLDQKIDYLLKRVRDSEFDDLLRSHLANYVCILLSGLLETAIREIISIHCESKTIPTISNFVKSRLEQFQNPDPERIANLLASFDPKLKERLENFWSGEVKDAIGSIVGNRHLIAHGRDTSLTLSRVSDWFASTRRLIVFIQSVYP